MLRACIVIGLCCAILLQPVRAACQAGEYTCYNGNCVATSLEDNAYNDCGDNSDEGEKFPCPERLEEQFKCYGLQNNGDGLCVDMSWVNDDRADCDDLSDEWKVLGTRCGTPSKGVFTLIPCDHGTNGMGEGGQCDTNTYTCVCRAGYAAQPNGKQCTKRRIGSACATDSECSAAVPKSECASGACACLPGLITVGTTECKGRAIGDACDSFIQCNAEVEYARCSETTNLCECATGLVPSSDNKRCNAPALVKSTTGPPVTRTTARTTTTTTTMYPTLADDDNGTWLNYTSNNATNTTSPQDEPLLPLGGIIGIAVSAAVVLLAIVLFACFLFVLLSICWTLNKEVLPHNLGAPSDPAAMAKNMDYENLESMMPRQGLLPPLPTGHAATVHLLNELPFHLAGDGEEGSPDFTPRIPPGSPTGDGMLSAGTATTELLPGAVDDGIEMIYLNGDGSPLIDGGATGKHTAKVSPLGGVKGKKGKKAKKAKKKKKKGKK